MDRLIKRFERTEDDDLLLCVPRGVAYQRDMKKGRVWYDAKYLEKFDAYDLKIETRVNYDRAEFVCDNFRREKSEQGRITFSFLDVGAGSIGFMEQMIVFGIDIKGFDVIPETVARLRAMGRFDDKATDYDVVTMWDTIEHLEHPEEWLSQIRRDGLLFVSLPIFDDLTKIRESKHYRPGEHLYYFTRTGFTDWIGRYGFRLLEYSNHETDAGREGIGAFAFVRDLPTYRNYIELYDKMHAERYYGSSAVELHFKTIADVVMKVKPTSILDFGCGRSDLLAYFWNDGKRTLKRYDPAIRKIRQMPNGRFDLVICCDVMEHIPMSSVDTVLEQIKSKTTRCVFTISTKLARAKLPDGQNAHCTILTTWEWIKWIRSYFPHVSTIESEWPHELILFATGDKR